MSYYIFRGENVVLVTADKVELSVMARNLKKYSLVPQSGSVAVFGDSGPLFSVSAEVPRIACIDKVNFFLMVWYLTTVLT